MICMARWRVTCGGSRYTGRGRRCKEVEEEKGGSKGRKEGEKGARGEAGSQPHCFLSARARRRWRRTRSSPPSPLPARALRMINDWVENQEEERIAVGGGGGNTALGRV